MGKFWLALAILLVVAPSFGVSRHIRVRHLEEEENTEEDFDYAVKNAAHNADFVHEFFIPGWWFCTLFNFFNELKEFGTPKSIVDLGINRLKHPEHRMSGRPAYGKQGHPTTESAFKKMMNEAYNADPEAPEVQYPEEMEDHLKVSYEEAMFMVHEFGLLEFRGLPGKMFDFSLESPVKDTPFGKAQIDGIPVPLPAKYRDLFDVRGNRELDRQGISLLEGDSFFKFVEFLQTLKTQQCNYEKSSGRYLPNLVDKSGNRMCVFPPHLQSLSRYDDHCVADEPHYFAKMHVFSEMMVNWYKANQDEQNKFAYHDDLHALLFATAAPLFLEMYSQPSLTHSHQKKITFEPEEYMAASMAGLYHDIGYFMIPMLDRVREEKGLKELGGTFDAGHELLSLIGALHVFDHVSVGMKPELQEKCRRIIAVTILATKVPFHFMFNPDIDVPAQIFRFIQGFLKDKPTAELFDSAKATAALVELYQQNPLKYEGARLDPLLKCAIAFWWNAGLEDAECGHIMDVLQALDQKAEVSWLDSLGIQRKARDDSNLPKKSGKKNIPTRRAMSLGTDEKELLALRDRLDKLDKLEAVDGTFTEDEETETIPEGHPKP